MWVQGEEEGHGQNGKIIFLAKSGILRKYLLHSFLTVWEEYKYHGIPYIQGTTVPCDYSEFLKKFDANVGSFIIML